MSTSPDGPSDQSIPLSVLQRAVECGQRPALHDWRDETWHTISFEDMAHRVHAAAAALVEGGHKPGARLGLVGPNSSHWGMAYLAILHAGCVAVPLDRMQSTQEWLDVLSRSGAVGVFAAEAESRKLFSALDDHESLITRYRLAGPAGDIPTFDQLAAAGASASLPPVAPDDLAAVLYTSGTTGKSKGVMLSHRNILSDARGMLAVVPFDGNLDRFLSVLPMSHCYECTGGFLAPLLAGTPIYYARGLVPREIVADLKSSGATILLGVPLLFEKVVAGIKRGLRGAGVSGRAAQWLWAMSRAGRPIWHTRFGKGALAGIRTKAGLETIGLLVSGGAPLPPGVTIDLEALGINIIQGYGLTETSPVATLNPPGRVRPASVGLPLPGARVKLDPEQADEGEILISGDMVTSGYWQDQAATDLVLDDGWFRTGDLGRIDKDGYLYITGRKKNLIVSPGGKNIAPEEIELAASASAAISEVLVYGKTTESGAGEEVCATIYPDLEYCSLQAWPVEQEEALLPHIRQEMERATVHLAAYKKVVHVNLTFEPFVKTTTQKIKRHLHKGDQG